VEWSWTTWLISVATVVVSGAIAWLEGNWTRRPGLAMGFVNHGGMWGDLVLLSVANAVVVPHLTWGPWLIGALTAGAPASMWAHAHWYHPPTAGPCDPGELVSARGAADGDHMWPRHGHGSWWRDLSWSGWAHVIYVTGELSLLVGFLLHAMPADVVVLVAAIFTIHVPIGLLQPRWYRTGHIATVGEQPLLAPLLLALWTVTIVKL
jgi:hypothetical protein